LAGAGDYAGTLWDFGEAQRKLEQEKYDQEAFKQYMQETWPLQQIITLQALLRQTPYGVERYSDSKGKKSSGVLGWLGTGLDILGTVLPFISDKRLKTNIRPLGGALPRVRKLRGVQWNWRGTGRRSAGLLAQDVERVEPDAVTSVDGVKMIHIPKVVGLLTEAVKELDEKVSRRKGQR